MKAHYQQGESDYHPDTWSQSNSSGLFLVIYKATSSDFSSFLFGMPHTNIESCSRQNKRQLRLFLSLSPDRLDRPLLRLPAGSQWRREAPLWVRRLHRIPNKGTAAGHNGFLWRGLWLWKRMWSSQAGIHVATEMKRQLPGTICHICCLLPCRTAARLSQ